jgi:hypothetical protein
VRVVDPDTWRNMGWKDPNHFLTSAKEYGDYPTGAAARYGAAIGVRHGHTQTHGRCRGARPEELGGGARSRVRATGGLP